MIYLDNTTEQQKVSIPKVTEGIAFITDSNTEEND